MANRKPQSVGETQKKYEPIFEGDIKGLDTFNSPKALPSNVLSDAENVFYDTGYIYNRNGAQVYADDPSYEPTAPLVQCIKCSDSKGNQYLLRYWNGIFDVWNATTGHWYNINPATSSGYQTAKITQKTSKWAYETWNNGWGNDVFTVPSQAISIGADLLYLGNGIDPMVRWVMAQTTITTALMNGATSLVLSDTTEFPGFTGATSQNIIVNGTVIQYTAKTGTYWTDLITLTNDPADNDTLTINITDGNGSHAIVVTFKTTPNGPGQVQRGGGNTVTAGSLKSLLSAPAGSGATWQAFTDSTIIGALAGVTFTVATKYVTMTEFTAGSISSVTSSTTTSGNTAVPTAPNVLTISAWGGATIAIGTPVYVPMQSVVQSGAYVIGGKYMTVVNSRLHWAGVQGFETFFYYSALNFPEVSAPIGSATGIDAGGEVEMSDGDGPITGISKTLSYVLIHKRDLVNEFFLQQDTVNNDNIPSFIPVASGDSSGSVNGFLTLTANLIVYFPTATQGICELIPSFSYTGVLSFQENIISESIQNIGTSVGYDRGDSIYYNGILFWSVSESASPTIPNLLIYYDLVHKNWGKIRGWNVTSLAEFNGDLLFTGIDSHLYKYDEQSYDDNNFDYESYGKTAEMSFGNPAELKQLQNAIYLSGLVGLDQNLYVDVMYNTNGVLQTDTYKITGNPVNPYITLTTMPLIGQNMIGINTIGIANANAEIGIFKVYLIQNVQYQWNTITLKFYSKDAGSSWAVDTASIAMVVVPAENVDLRLFINTA